MQRVYRSEFDESRAVMAVDDLYRRLSAGTPGPRDPSSSSCRQKLTLAGERHGDPGRYFLKDVEIPSVSFGIIPIPHWMAKTGLSELQ